MTFFCRAMAADPRVLPDSDAMRAVMAFANNMLEYGRDHYGEEHSPLFVNQLDVRTRVIPEEGRGVWSLPRERRMGGSRTGSNFHFDTGLLRLLQTLSVLTGNKRYAAAVDANLRHVLGRTMVMPTGMVVRGSRLVLPGGDHLKWDVVEDRPYGHFHEMRSSRFLWAEMFALNPRATVSEIETYHEHIIAPEVNYAFNRHYPLARTRGSMPPADALSLPSSAGVYIHAWAFLYSRTGDKKYLGWAQNLADYLWENRGRKTDIIPSAGERKSRRNAFDTPGSRVVYGLEPWRSYIAFLLYAAGELRNAPEATRKNGEAAARAFRNQAEASLSAFARHVMSPDGGFYAALNIDTGRPPPSEQAKEYGVTSVAPDHRIWESSRFHQVFATLAFAYRETHFAELRPALDAMSAQFSHPDAPRRENMARDIALPILAFTHLYEATGESVFLEKARPWIEVALLRYWQNGFFVSGPARGMEKDCDPWSVYSNRSGSAHLAYSILRYELVRAGKSAAMMLPGDDVVADR